MGPAGALSSSKGRHLTSKGRVGLFLLELKAHLGFLHSREGHEADRIRINGCPNGIEALVSDPILEPEDVQRVGQGVNPVLLQVVMLDMSLVMEGNVLVKGKATPLAIKAERLELGHDGRAGCNQLLAAQELGMEGMEGPIGFAPILSLSCCGSRVGPGLRGPPDCMEDIIHLH